MRSAGYVGRVGALAFALGIGAVIAGVPGVAWADTEGEPDPSDAPGVSAPKNPDSSAGDPSDTEVVGGDESGDAGEASDSGDVDGTDDSEGGMQVGNSGGPITSTSPGSAGAKSKQKDDDADPPKKRSTVKEEVVSVAPSPTTTTTQSTATTVTDPVRKARSQAPTLSVDPPKDVGPQFQPSTSLAVDVAPLTLVAPGLQKPVPARMTAVTKPLAQSPVSRLLPFVMLAPTADGKQPGTTESPLLLGFLAAGRQVDKKASVEDESIARTVDSTETSLVMMSAAAKITPTASPTKRDNVKPTVIFTVPATVSGSVTLNPTASDNVGVTEVRFFVDNNNTPLAVATTLPYSASWDTKTVANGNHTLKAVARDAAGNTMTSTVNVTVDNTKPTVSLAAPTNGAPVSGTVTLAATASDNVGVTGVQFWVDNAPLGAEDTIPDYNASWDTTTVTDGIHTLTAVARDDAGNITISTVTVTVDNQQSTTVPVTVTSIPVNSYPSAVAFSGDYAFVYGGDVIWTIDTRTNEITDWTAFYNEPPEISDGTRRYEYEPGYMSVSVVDNKTNAVVDTIDIPTCDSCGYAYGGLEELAISPDGTRLYARHTYWVDEYSPLASAVTVIDTSKIDTSNNEVLGTTGPIFAKDIEIGADGRVYTIDEDWYYPDVIVHDQDMRNPYSIPLTSWTGSAYSFPTTLAMSTDGKHAFLHVYDLEGGGMTVSIIDTDLASPTYNAETYMTERYSAVSPDGTRLYVPEMDGKTITVYDAATNAVIGSFVTDEQTNESYRGVYFAPNGTLYVADPGDNTLYAVTIGGTTAQESIDDATAQRTADTGQMSLMLMSATGNTAPTAAPSMGTPNQTTGTIIGNLNATDTDGNSLIYAVPTAGDGAPTKGTVSINSGTGAFTYSPSTAARLAAGTTAAPDFDTFTVSVMDGQATTPVTVSVPVLPAVWANQPSTNGLTGTSPYGVAVVNNTAYVANQGTNTVTMVDTLTGQRIGNPIVVGSAPTGVVASPTGDYVFVSNRTSGTVSVIRAADSRVIDVNPATSTVDSIKVGSQPEFMAINTSDIVTNSGTIKAGTRLYVSNYGSGTLTVMDITNPAAPKVIDTNPLTTTTVDAIKVGSNPRGVAFASTPNGPRIFVVNRSSGTVSVIDPATNKAVDTNPLTTSVDAIKVGTAPEQIAISPDGKFAYVTNYTSKSVSIIDTATYKLVDANPATTTADAIAMPSNPAGVAFSRDGSLVYVVNANDRISVIDAKTRTVINTLQIDTGLSPNYHTIAVRDDGSLVVTDLAERAVRIVNYQRGNTAPTILANPTVDTAITSTGAVSGLINIRDWDGDALDYSTGQAPTMGSVTFDRAAGTYTYTPTQAARHAAAQNPDLTDTFTIRATDTRMASTTTAPVTIQILPSATPPPVRSTSPIKSADPYTGEIRGSLGVTGSNLSYTVINAPTKGTVTFTPQGDYVYRPTQAARLAADQTPGDDTDSFAVRVSNGQTTTTVTVAAPVLPAQLTVDNQFTPALGGAPGAVDLNYRKAWIANQADGTLSIIDVPSGSPVATIPVGTSPTSIAFDGMAYAWVTNQGSNTVSVVDLVYNPGSVTTLSGFNQPSAVITDYPGVVFVANKGNGTVSAINASSRQVIATYQVGHSPTAMALTGAHIYVVNSGSNTLSMIDLETNSVRATIPVGTAPTAVAVNPKGTRVYVTNSDGTVTVIDAGTNTVIGSPVRVGPQPTSVAVSPDGSLAYVANTDDTVSVIDTRTNTVVRTVVIDPNPEMGSHSLTISQELVYPPRSPDGARVYITDAADRTMRAIALTSSQPPEITATTTAIPVTGPLATAVAGNKAYVVSSDYNSYTNNVSVIDVDPASSTYKQVVDTIPIGYMNGYYVPPGPTIVATQLGDRVFVTNYEDNTVLAIDTDTNTVGATYQIPVQQPEYYEMPNGVYDVIVSRDGSRMYVTATDGYIRVIDTASGSALGDARAGTGMAVSADGSLLYVTGGDAIAVYDTDSMTKVGEIHLGPSQFDSWRGLMISDGGTRAYVTGRVQVVEDANAGYFNGENIIRDPASGNLWRVVGSYDVVSVIDISDPSSTTYNKEIATIPIAAGAWNVATNSDGSLVYVTASDGKTVTVIDTDSNTVIGRLTTDQSGVGVRSISVGANDMLYVTDGYDGTIYAVTVGDTTVL